MTMKLGFCLPQFDTYDLTTDVAEAAAGLEKIGYDSVWATERLLVPQDQSGPHGLYGISDLPWPPFYRNIPDPLLVLATAGVVTSRIRLGTSVLVPPLHLPTRLAKNIASLDLLTGGRVVAGLGSGWSIDEFAATAPRPFSERGDALDEFLDVAAAVWGPDPAHYKNDRYTIGPADFGPKPTRKIPLLLAGGSRKSLDRIARRGDGWIPNLMAPPAVIGATIAGIREKAAAYGRTDHLSCVGQLAVWSFDRVTTTDRAPYTGDAGQLAEDVAALAEAGVDEVFMIAATSDRTELLDRAADFHDAVRSAGL